MKAEGVSFRHAVELLRAGVAVRSEAAPAKTSTVRKLPPPVDRDADDAAMLEQVVSLSHETLKQSPKRPAATGAFRLPAIHECFAWRVRKST